MGQIGTVIWTRGVTISSRKWMMEGQKFNGIWYMERAITTDQDTKPLCSISGTEQGLLLVIPCILLDDQPYLLGT